MANSDPKQSDVPESNDSKDSVTSDTAAPKPSSKKDKTAPSNPKKSDGTKKITPPKFFQLAEESGDRSQPMVMVVYDVDRDITAGNVSGSKAIRYITYAVVTEHVEIEKGVTSPQIDNLILYVGCNPIMRSRWEACVAYYENEKSFKKRLERGAIKVLEPKNKKSELTRLDDLEHEDATTAIAYTYDSEQLKTWQRETNSQALSTAIAAQLAFINDEVAEIAAKKQAMMV